MKKTIFFILLFAILSLTTAFSVNAQETTNNPGAIGAQTTNSVNLGIENPGMLPISPFYFLKEWGRGINKFFIFDPVKKVELELREINERAAEIKKVEEIAPQNIKALERASINYQKNTAQLENHLKNLKKTSQNPDVNNLLNNLIDTLSIHQELFGDLGKKIEANQEISTSDKAELQKNFENNQKHTTKTANTAKNAFSSGGAEQNSPATGRINSTNIANLKCPTLVPPSPDSCGDGEWMAERTSSGCSIFKCLSNTAGINNIENINPPVQVNQIPFINVIDNMNNISGWKVMSNSANPDAINPDAISLSTTTDAFNGKYAMNIILNRQKGQSVWIYKDFENLNINPEDYDYIGCFVNPKNDHWIGSILFLDSLPIYSRDAWASYYWSVPKNWTLFAGDLQLPMNQWKEPFKNKTLHLLFYADQNETIKSLSMNVDYCAVVGKGLRIKSDVYRMGVLPGNSITFQIPITRTLGVGTDTFNILLKKPSALEFEYKLSINKITLKRHETKTIKLVVKVPLTAKFNKEEIVNLVVTSATNPKITTELALTTKSQQNEAKINIDYKIENGPIKPIWRGAVHPPSTAGLPEKDLVTLLTYMNEANINLIRKDLAIGEIFPVSGKPDADPNDLKEYDFTSLDKDILDITSYGRIIPIISYTPKALSSVSDPFNGSYGSYPPKDYEQYGEVAKHIVMHLTQGWANGYYLADKIAFWEVWNEPDSWLFWRGTKEDYFRLFKIIANKIKSINKKYLIAGPVIAIPDIAYIDAFLNYMSLNDVPVDIVDYHQYSSDPWQFSKDIEQVEGVIKKYSKYSGTELAISEWNANLDDVIWDKKYDANTMFRAWHNVETLIQMIKKNISYATHYMLTDNQFCFPGFLSGPWGFFSFSPFQPKPVYYGIKALDFLSDASTQISSTNNNKNIDLIAGKSKDKVVIVINNWNSSNTKTTFSIRNLPWLYKNYKFYVLDEKTYQAGKGLMLSESKKFIDKNTKLTITIPKESISVIVIQK